MAEVLGAKGSEVTSREAEVLALLAEHLTNVQIADALCISVRTVESHVSSLLRKLQLSDRRSLARHADRIARLPPPRWSQALPAPVTPFVGRATERAALSAALDAHRLVTATGPGGIGKTRLALAVADDVAARRRDGAWFVDLVNVTDPAMVASAVASVVGAAEQRTDSIDAALVAALARRDGLLVLDNCEHLVDGVRDCVERIVAACPDVTVLATSRSRLMLPYERIFAVPGLSVTDEGGDAVELFTSRLAAVTGAAEPLDARRVALLCRALDGIALAIELAAARFPTLGLDGLEAGLDERMRLLTARPTSADRHRSLREAIAWSYDLLDDDDQALLRGVAVLSSSFDVEAARAVAAPRLGRNAVADGLSRLADDSLLIVERGEPTRYRALETIRQFGVERLAEAGELAAVRTRHEAWCRGKLDSLATTSPDDEWRARFDRVADDLRAALLWAADDSRRRDAAQLAAGLAGLLYLRGRPTEAQRRYEQAAELDPSPAARADHLRLAAGAAAGRYVGAETQRLLRAAAAAAMEAGDHAGAACDLAWMSIYIDRFPGILAEPPSIGDAAARREEAAAISDGSPRPVAAVALAGVTPINFARSFSADAGRPSAVDPALHAVELGERSGDPLLESGALDQLTAARLALDDVSAAVEAVRRRGMVIDALRLGAGTGFEVHDYHLMATDVQLAAGDLVAAGEHAEALARLPFIHEQDHLALTRSLRVWALAGRLDEVVAGGERFLLSWEHAGRPAAPELGCSAYAVALAHGIRGDEGGRCNWRRVTLDLGVPEVRLDGLATGWAPVFDAIVALHHDDVEAAVDRLGADLDDRSVWGFWNTAPWRPWYAALWAEAAALAGRLDARARIAAARHATRHNPVAAAIVERAAAIDAADRRALAGLAGRFAELACPYQEQRSRSLLEVAG